MIGPKTPKPSKKDEHAAYEAATERDQGRCVRCGWVGVVHRDHRQNREPGNTVVCNLQLLCAPHGDDQGCHRWKTLNVTAATLEGFSVPRWSRPELWPGWRHDVQSWVVYFDAPDADGNWWRPISESTAALLMNGGA
jgi:hypothetical protein